ncbi:SRPBCC family protein [Streptomyces sp. Tu 3180]|uniref:SRPBCC family protein n=1 Tax=Streptomyces sp. Tu 3180 TaxID=2682611 RepID=UPI00140D91C0|nr:SRPBCC family protein [Streptomyces sp. Tu 3180]KAF3469284.1 SRPBCC family protein [Streptomyces sp. Tu 3180]
MGRLTLRATGPARPATVWQRYADVDQWASWSPQIRAVHANGRTLAPGLSGTVESVVGVRAAFTVEAVDHRRHRWTWRVRLGPVRLRLDHEVHAHPRGSRTSLVMDGPVLAAAAYAPFARLALRRLVRS